MVVVVGIIIPFLSAVGVGYVSVHTPESHKVSDTAGKDLGALSHYTTSLCRRQSANLL